MTDAVATARLEELRRLAYGRSGGLTPEQAEELRELEHGLRAEATEASPPNERADAAGADPGAGESYESLFGDDALPEEPSRQADDPRVGAEVPAAAEAAVATRSRSTRRNRWVLATTAVVAVALGVGIGWLLAQEGDARPGVPAAEADTFAALEAEGGFDPDSLEYLGTQDGASLWVATKADRSEDCLLLTAKERTNVQCIPADTDPWMLSANLEIPTDDGRLAVWGTTGLDVQGNQVGIIRTQSLESTDDDWSWQFSSEEQVEAKQLVDAGFDGASLSIVGYDEDRTVWVAYGEDACIAVVLAGEPQTSCGPLGTHAEQALELAVDDSIYSVRMTDTRGPQLTVLKQVAAGSECVVHEDGTARCTSIDDKTGQTGQ